MEAQNFGVDTLLGTLGHATAEGPLPLADGNQKDRTRAIVEELDLKVPGGRIFIHDEFFLSSGFGKKRTDPTWGHVMLTAMVNMTTGTILTGHKSPSSG